MLERDFVYSMFGNGVKRFVLSANMVMIVQHKANYSQADAGFLCAVIESAYAMHIHMQMYRSRPS